MTMDFAEKGGNRRDLSSGKHADLAGSGNRGCDQDRGDPRRI